MGISTLGAAPPPGGITLRTITANRKKDQITMKNMMLAAAALLAAMSFPALAEGDAAKGEKVFLKCKTCHDVDKGVSKVGPTLKGVIGRPVASVEGFKYSEDMLARGKEGAVWDEAILATYLPDPKAYVPKTKMVFAGLKKSEDVTDLIAYLKTKP
jgi:cytochrome c